MGYFCWFARSRKNCHGNGLKNTDTCGIGVRRQGPLRGLRRLLCVRSGPDLTNSVKRSVPVDGPELRRSRAVLGGVEGLRGVFVADQAVSRSIGRGRVE